ncbi:MAG: PAS domain S-box-containing protein, partial [Salinirussus sp.]
MVLSAVVGLVPGGESGRVVPSKMQLNERFTRPESDTNRMLSLGPGPLRVGVLGDGSAEATLSGADSVDRSLDIEPVEPDVVTGRQGQGFHCVVVDSASGVGCPDAVEECVDACPELPVVALTNGADDGAIAALEAGADETLPATVTETAPGLLAERVVSTVEREHARDGLQEMYDGVAGGVTLHDPDTGELLHANRRACETLGYSREELRALSLEGLTGDVAGYDGERARAIVDRALRREEPVTLEWPFERADGTVRWTDSRVEAATFCSQELVLWASTDAAERHHQEYEQIFNSVNDAIAVFDPDTGEITDINDSYRAMVGYDDLETVRELGIEGLSVAEEGYTGERGQALISEVAETGDSTTVEWQAETRSGERLWLEATLAPGTVGGEQRVLSIQRDITARKRREREYEQVFNGVPDPITVNDPETGEMVAVNDAMCEAVGYDRETVLEKGVDGLSVTEEGYTSERAAEIVDRVLSSGEAETFEWKLETADGDIRVLEVTGKPATVGGERRYISLTRDITERKRREREYEQVFNSVTDGIVVFDPEAGELTDVNDTYLEMVGYDSLEAIREVGAEGLSADGPEFTEERVDAIVDRVAETGETETVEWAVERADGERRVFEVNSTTATIGGERRVLSLNRDVTEQRRTERRLEAILERIDEAIFMTRAEEITTASRAPDYVSSGYEEIWGQPVERIRETYEEGFFATLHPDDEAGYRAFVEGVVEDIVAGDAADRYAREYRVERPDGEVRWVHSDYYPAEWETGSPRVVIVSRDITERKARERRIASFDDATDGLATADTPAEAAHTAVEAATE